MLREYTDRGTALDYKQSRPRKRRAPTAFVIVIADTFSAQNLLL